MHTYIHYIRRIHTYMHTYHTYIHMYMHIHARYTYNAYVHRSVDGTVRRYDIRFGKLYSDTIGRKCHILTDRHYVHIS